MEEGQRFSERDEQPPRRGCQGIVILSGAANHVGVVEGESGHGDVAGRGFLDQERRNLRAIELNPFSQQHRDIEEVLSSPAITDRLLEQRPQFLGDDVLKRCNP